MGNESKPTPELPDLEREAAERHRKACEAAGFRLVMRKGTPEEKRAAADRRRFRHKWYGTKHLRMPCQRRGVAATLRKESIGPLAMWVPRVTA